MKRLFWLSLLSILLVPFGRAEEQKVDDEGFIHDWVLLAPIGIQEGAGGEEIDKEQIKDEGKQRPKVGDKTKVGDKALTWTKVHSKDYFFDVNEILGAQTEDSACYAVCYVVADDEIKDVQLQMGSNDQGKAYLNEKEAVKFTETRTLEKDQNAAEHLTLNKGVNLLVFKVINEKNNWQGCIRFKTAKGDPIKNIKVRLEP